MIFNLYISELNIRQTDRQILYFLKNEITAYIYIYNYIIIMMKIHLNISSQPLMIFNLYISELNIQSATHDSVEDAITAVQLYHKYQEMSKEGMDNVRAKIKEMYEEGRKIQWKIPDVEEEEGEEQVALL